MSITCDNASANDVMIDDLPQHLPNFPGKPNHTQCFNHTIALVAMRIVRQFDVPSAGEGDQMSEAEEEL